MCFQLVNLGKSITDFSTEGDEEKDKDKEDMDQDEDHEKLDEEMGERNSAQRHTPNTIGDQP